MDSCPKCHQETVITLKTGLKVCRTCGWKEVNTENPLEKTAHFTSEMSNLVQENNLTKPYLDKVLKKITLGAVNYNYGVITPLSFGRQTTLELTEHKLIEHTKKYIATRYCEIRLSTIDSVEIIEEGILFLLALGIATLFLYGIGFIFIVLYFFIKHKYLIIHSGSNIIAAQIKSGNQVARVKDFLNKIILQSEKQRKLFDIYYNFE